MSRDVAIADRWFRRYEVGPPELWRGTIRYAYVRAEAAWRPGKRALRDGLRPLVLRLNRLQVAA